MVLGIVLAGGQSRRMGTDKAMLTVEGKTQLQRATDCLVNAGCEQIAISRNEVGFVTDQFLQQGPLAGIQACLAAYQCHEAVVIPVDMPLIESRSIAALIQFGRTQGHSCYFESSALPCYLSDLEVAKAQCMQRLQHGKRSINGFLQAIAAKPLRFKQNNLAKYELLNSNTPQQWQLAQHLMINKERAWDGQHHSHLSR